MNRCLFLLCVARRYLLAIAVALASSGLLLPWPARAQSEASVRVFPPTALRGKLLVVAPPEVRIDGRIEKLAPGARIRDLQNMFIMSGALIGREFVVNFTREPGGMVRDVWVLSEAEIAQEIQAATPRRNFRFASEADAPKVDDGKTPYKDLPGYGPPKR